MGNGRFDCCSNGSTPSGSRRPGVAVRAGTGQVAQTRTDCPNYGQRLRDGSCQNRKANWRQGRGKNAGQRGNMARWGGGPGNGAGNRGPAQN